MKMKSALFTCFVIILTVNTLADEQHRIGGIFYEGSEEQVAAFNLAAERFNFAVETRMVHPAQILQTSKHVCELAQIGVLGIIDSTGGRASSHAQAVCDALELPHATLQHNDLSTRDWSCINLFPSADSFNKLMEAIVQYKDWSEFAILYAKGHSLSRVSNLLRMSNATDRYIVAVRELSGDDYRDVLIDVKTNGFTNFVVDCPTDRLESLLSQAQQVGLMSDEHSYVFVSLDLFTLELDPYRYGGANVTGFTLVNPMSNEELYKFAAEFQAKSGIPLEAHRIKTEVALVYDAVQAFAEAIAKMTVQAQPLDCNNYDHWMYGSSFLNFMRTNKFQGLTGMVIFDGFGERSNFSTEILEMIPSGNQSIGAWSFGVLKANNPVITIGDINENSIMANKTFKVLIATVAPYGYEKLSPAQLAGNDRYEGFAVDLIDELSNILGFNYEFEVENTYGSLDKSKQKWNGMVQQIMEEKADFGICDFTITSDRQNAIDFTTPFMTLGIGILYKQPSKQPPEMFSFMAVFSQEVWMYMMFSQLGLGMIMVFVGRISHKEWQNPVPCVEQPEELSNQFSFANSVWLIIGSVMQQGSEIAPIALAPRMITSIWWFFTMVMVASYTGTLVAFLTVESNVLPFNTPEELLALHKSIRFGCKESGSTNTFFEESDSPPFNEMFQMMKNKGWRMPSNDDGVAMAENSSYAFFMESTSLEYYTERHCDLMQVGDLLDSKGYGIGMKNGSVYKVYMDDALLKLKERGVIQKLKDKWWKEKRGGGKCEDRRDEELKQLGMKNLLGAFVVLGVGCIIGLFISIMDMLWGVFKKSVKYSTTFKYELIEELKFAIKFSGDIKPVKRPQKSAADGSAEALAQNEGGDELRSLHSIRSLRSKRSARSDSNRSNASGDTHHTHHTHSSKHSSRSQSVAFARRREYT